jgi:hypothetical protein
MPGVRLAQTAMPEEDCSRDLAHFPPVSEIPGDLPRLIVEHLRILEVPSLRGLGARGNSWRGERDPRYARVDPRRATLVNTPNFKKIKARGYLPSNNSEHNDNQFATPQVNYICYQRLFFNNYEPTERGVHRPTKLYDRRDHPR